MSKALSLDLRERVVAAVSGGMSRRQAAERFGVSAASAVRWCALDRDTGSAKARPQGGDRHSHRIEAQADLIMSLVDGTSAIMLMEIQIEHGYHALAIDEHRKAFAPTLWSIRTPKDPGETRPAPRTLANVEQRWFVGAHGNVGGGYESDLLAQAPLRWIMKKASLYGLTFRNDVEIDGDMLTATVNDSREEFLHGAYASVSRNYFRAIGGDPDVRDNGTHTNVNETIDQSVFDRWRVTPTYRPQNLTDWAKRKNVDPTAIRNSVRADDPSVVAPD